MPASFLFVLFAHAAILFSPTYTFFPAHGRSLLIRGHPPGRRSSDQVRPVPCQCWHDSSPQSGGAVRKRLCKNGTSSRQAANGNRFPRLGKDGEVVFVASSSAQRGQATPLTQFKHDPSGEVFSCETVQGPAASRRSRSPPPLAPLPYPRRYFRSFVSLLFAPSLNGCCTYARPP